MRRTVEGAMILALGTHSSGSGVASACPGVSKRSVQMPEERRHLGRTVLGRKMTQEG